MFLKKRIILYLFIAAILAIFIFIRYNQLKEMSAEKLSGETANGQFSRSDKFLSETTSSQKAVDGSDGNQDESYVEKTADLISDVVDSGTGAVNLINPSGMNVQERIMAPEGFVRVEVEGGSFGEYLRNLPVKPHGSRVLYYNGGTKPVDVHAAVLDIDIGDRDLQQCADSIIRLRAEYLYSKGLYDKIHFNFTNGFNADYSTWMKGNRIKVSGNNVSWVRQGEASNSYESFRNYLDMVFAYAGTMSLSSEMKSIPVEEMKPGDVFIQGGSPGHCVIVMDMAENKDGEKLFILAQGYMPAQEIHILKNPANEDGNPWYTLNFGENLETPEWEFTKDQLKRFMD